MTAVLDIDDTPLRSHPQARLVVALSGGLDSSVLLHALATTPALRAHGLRAVHVNHGLHDDAGAWSAHCESLCRALGVPLRTVRVDVRNVGNGPEAAARNARHAALQADITSDDVVAFAHHRDDQAETFLLRALRASAPDGLAAMRPWRAFGRGHLWRPLLALPRESLRAYATAHGLDWVDDPSNDDDRFDRNFLRLRVIPLLRERWPRVDEAFATAARLAAETGDLLADEDVATLARCRIDGDNDLSRNALIALDSPRRARVLRRWIASRDLPPLPANGVERIVGELLEAPADAQARFDWHGATVRAWRDRLHASRNIAPLDVEFDMAWDGRTPVELPDGGQLAIERPVPLPPGTRVRARQGGERIRLPGRPHRHELKDVLVAAGIPPWVREHLPLVFADDEVLAAGDRVIGDRLARILEPHGARIVWTPPI
ncbi:tRNA lysidine(34) synthetase TilS [Lysobacter claricitrinus]|uniref:tRNA lysidine(34) synthetase TilS n=1 Tax=Lysobacter claricitrinus TaxID=3367728 RepID=UPI0037DBA055